MATGASNCRRRRHPDRCAQGRAHPDQAAQLHLLAARHPARRAWRSTRSTSSVSTTTVSTRSSPTTAASPRTLGFLTVTPIPMSARYGDNVTDRSEQMPWYAGPTLVEYLETIDVDTDLAEQAVPLPGAVGQPAQPRLPRLLRHRRLRRHQGRRPDRRRRLRQARSRSPSIVTCRWRPEVGLGRRRRHRLTWPTRSISRAATCWSAPRTGRRWPTSSPPTCCGWPRRRCFPAAPT